jgi:hypothetical protein
MAIILQTMITNKLKQDRTVRWAGARGVHLPGNKSVILDGAYPTACKSKQTAKQLEEEVRQGWVELTLITNLPTAEPVGGAGAVKNPVAIQQNAANKADIPEVTKETKEGIKNEERFVKKEDAQGPLAPETKKLPGTENLEIPEPVTVELFPDGVTLQPQEGAKEEPVAEEPVAEEPVAEEPVAEEPVKEEAPAAEAPKPRRRRAAKKK